MKVGNLLMRVAVILGEFMLSLIDSFHKVVNWLVDGWDWKLLLTFLITRLFGSSELLGALVIILLTSILIVEPISIIRLKVNKKFNASDKLNLLTRKGAEVALRMTAWGVSLIIAYQLSIMHHLLNWFDESMQLYIGLSESLIIFNNLEDWGVGISLKEILSSLREKLVRGDKVE